MKTSIAVALALSLFAGSASAFIRSDIVANEVNFAYTDGNVVVHMNGSTATLVGNVESALDANRVVQATLASEGVNRVINLISIKH